MNVRIKWKSLRCSLSALLYSRLSGILRSPPSAADQTLAPVTTPLCPVLLVLVQAECSLRSIESVLGIHCTTAFWLFSLPPPLGLLVEQLPAARTCRAPRLAPSHLPSTLPSSPRLPITTSALFFPIDRRLTHAVWESESCSALSSAGMDGRRLAAQSPPRSRREGEKAPANGRLLSASECSSAITPVKCHFGTHTTMSPCCARGRVRQRAPPTRLYVLSLFRCDARL
ncbi:hypothetical protein C8Q77DRAFT_291002 [Trametes polyzona]|nr:hypothetical protein C8Q77DRAFT_291002 [Trametes polyzona]